MLRVDTSRSSLPSSPSASQRDDGEQSRDGPLVGVVVCLTGLSAHQKTKLHGIVEGLGGKYARELNTSETTHLVASVTEGAKYHTASSCSHISIVAPEWLVACADTRSRVDEDEYKVTSSLPIHNEKTKTGSSLMDLVESLQHVQNRNVFLFSSCHFFLAGFENEKSSDLHVKLCRLIRRARGTIYWHMNESITHIIVNEECEDGLQDVGLTHPNAPAHVSPLWVPSCLKEQTLLSPSKFIPQKQASATKLKSSAKKSKREEKRANARLFRGSLFTLLRLTPPEDTVDFDNVELEKLISSHGGQLLSSKWLDALKADSNRNGCKRRKCYVVTWGGYTPSHVAVHPLLSQIKRYDLCDIVLVTPIWIQTCIKDDKEMSPSGHPILFEPQSWPICKIGGSNKKTRAIRACVTGFVGGERTGLIYLLGAIGAVYTDNMKSSNTHLICKVGKGPKYEKAVEWGLHVVSVEWLYHVVQYGYSGKKESDNASNDAGCEEKFALEDSNALGDSAPKRKKRRTSPTVEEASSLLP